MSIGVRILHRLGPALIALLLVAVLLLSAPTGGTSIARPASAAPAGMTKAAPIDTGSVAPVSGSSPSAVRPLSSPGPATGSGPGWTAIGGGSAPSPRGAVDMASSASDNITLLYSGSLQNATVDQETWELVNGSWSDLTPGLASSPPPEGGAGLVYDSADGYFLMFGGLDKFGGIASDQTWKFQNGTWTNLTSSVSGTPPGRFGQVMVYDARDGYVVMFGGYDVTNSPLGDTWTYSAGTWSQLSPLSSPTARVYSSGTYDARLGKVVLFGGAGSSATISYNDTWEFQGGSWTNVTPNGTSPAARRGPTLAYDPRYGYDVLFGGNTYSTGSFYNDTWVFANGQWSDVTDLLAPAPGARFVSASSFDPTLNAVVQFGGCAYTACTSAYNDTYRYDFNLSSAALVPSSAHLAVNTTLRLTADAAGGSLAYSYVYAGLPPGCSTVNASVLSCVPSATGNFTPSVTVSDTYAPPGDTPAEVSAVSPVIQIVAALSVLAAASRPSLDVGQTVWINVTATGGGGTRAFSYSGLPAGCTSSDTSSLPCSPTAAGAFVATVRVQDTFGDSVTVNVAFVVDQALGLSVHASRSVAEVGQSVVFTALTSGGLLPISVDWLALPADCTLTTLTTANCTPTAAGTLLLSVQENDSNGAQLLASSPLVTVVAEIYVRSMAAPGSGTAPLTVALTTLVSGGIGPFSTMWSFGDGGSSISANTTHVFTTPGIYTVQVQVNDSVGFGSTSTVIVEVAPPPAVSMAPSPSTVDVGQTTTLSAFASNLSSPITFVWSGLPTGCAPANISQITCHPTGAGTFPVRVTASNSSGARATATATLIVLPAVSASIAVAPGAGCDCSCGATFIANFSATVTGGEPPYRFAWAFGDGTTGSTPNPSHAYTPLAAGETRSVNLTVNDSLGEPASAVTTVAVPAASCPSGGGPPGVAVWEYVLGGAIAIAGVAAVIYLGRRRGPGRGTDEGLPEAEGEQADNAPSGAPLDDEGSAEVG